MPNLRPQVVETPLPLPSSEPGASGIDSERRRLNFEQRRLEYTRQLWRSQGSSW